MAAINTFTDDFTGTTIDTGKWGANYGNVSQNDEAIVTPSTGAGTYIIEPTVTPAKFDNLNTSGVATNTGAFFALL